MKLVSIILPTYNEAGNILPLIKTIKKVVKHPKEIIVVDDDSPDGTSNLVSEYIKRSKNRTFLITRKKDRGLTNSIREGIEFAHGDVIVWMDCDFSHPPAIINELLKKIREGNDIAVASRFIKGGGFEQGEKENPLAVILSRVMNYSIQLLLGTHFGDYTSGFVAAKKKVFSKIKLTGDYGEYFIDFIYRSFARKYKIVEVPYIQKPRVSGTSKTGNNLLEYLLRGRKYVTVSIQLVTNSKLLGENHGD